MRRVERLAEWSTLLRSVAGAPPPLGSVLGAGKVDQLLLAAIHRTPPQDDFRANAPPAPTDAPEVRLWRWVHQADPDLEASLSVGHGPILSPLVTAPPRTGSDTVAVGGLATPTSMTIETWTESELASVHALAHRAFSAGAATGASEEAEHWRRRLALARRWHLEHTQPDNATNRPWAIASFLVGSGGDGRFYAETLLHNALAQLESDNALCAALLHDAADLIERAGQIGLSVNESEPTSPW